jgi:hypothetical protein
MRDSQHKTMKLYYILTVLASTLVALPLMAQNEPAAATKSASSFRPMQVQDKTPLEPEYHFNLDFPGGTPQELVAAIQKASGQPLNAVVPRENTNIFIPPLKMTNVTPSELFQALKRASIKLIKYVSTKYGNSESYSQYQTSYGFESDGRDNSRVWYFRVDNGGEPQIQNPVCHFYSLASYFDKNTDTTARTRRVEDITTAIQTGWKLKHITPMPELKFHPETGLLIAVGQEEDLKLINEVLEQLKPVENSNTKAKSATPANSPAPEAPHS